MILLHTSDSSGTGFVRTDQLDGETDWKVRESVKYTQELGGEGLDKIIRMSWNVLVEAPSDLIYYFKGVFTAEPQAKERLKPCNTLWANMKIASGEVLGIVISTGKETRIELNNSDTDVKYGKTDEEVNTMTKYLFVILVIISVLLTILSGKILERDGIVFFTRIFILTSSIIPISMKVNIDFAKLYYSLVINQDDHIKGAVTRNSSIPEELGRIEYLLSDKTGTLTKNVMMFKKLRSLERNFEEEEFDELKRLLKEHCEILKDPNPRVRTREAEFVYETLLSFLLCNNVTPIEDESGRTLQAASPDEVSLVKFAEAQGFIHHNRKIYEMTVKDPLGTLTTFEILKNFPFSSARKRMGILLKNKETGKIRFLLKGADSIMMTKLSENEQIFVGEETEKLSREGFRTLVFASKNLSDDEWGRLEEEFKEAELDMNNREVREEEVIEELEKDMLLDSITGVEDMLQDNVKDCIMHLREAGIKGNNLSFLHHYSHKAPKN